MKITAKHPLRTAYELEIISEIPYIQSGNVFEFINCTPEEFAETIMQLESEFIFDGIVYPKMERV